jgi:hypothetical protein
VGPIAGLDSVEQKQFLALPGLKLWPFSHPAHTVAIPAPVVNVNMLLIVTTIVTTTTAA